MRDLSEKMEESAFFKGFRVIDHDSGINIIDTFCGRGQERRQRLSIKLFSYLITHAQLGLWVLVIFFPVRAELLQKQ